MSSRLSETRTVTLNAQGAGTVQLTPTRHWRITRLTTYGTSTTAPQLVVRRSSPDGPMVDSTRFGNGDTSETTLEVFAGEVLVASYVGGTPGAVMSFYVEGEQD